MINTNTKPKRKHQFIIIETGQQVYLDRIQTANTYFVCDSPALSLDDNYFPIDVSLLKEAGKQRTGISAKRKALTEAKKTEKQNLNEFFASLKIPYNCQECQKPLYAFTSFAKRCVSAHLLPKAIFKSIATHELNIAFLGSSLLGVCSCHNFYDQGLKERMSMKIYPDVLQVYKELKKSLTSREIEQANEYLGL